MKTHSEKKVGWSCLQTHELDNVLSYLTMHLAFDGDHIEIEE